MYKGKRIAVVVPAYNESKLIQRVLDTVPEFVDRIIVVNDCSKDDTRNIVQKYADSNPERFMLINHEVNQGVGGAIASGYIWCRDNNIDVAAVMAGDAQMDPTELEALLQPVVDGEADYAKGNRLVSGEAWRKIPKVRYLGNSALSLFTKIASGYWHIADSQCGYTAINHKALATLNWNAMYKRYGQPNDLLVRLNVYRFRVQDVPVEPVYGIGEISGIRPLSIIPRLSWLLIKRFIWRIKEKYIIRDFHPLVFFYMVAFMLMFISIPLGIRILVFWLAYNYIPPINTMAFIFTGIMGTQFLLFGMWFDMEYDRK